MKKAFIKRPLSALLTVIMMLSALPLLATGSSAALPGGLDSYITVNSDKIAALSKKATTDGLIKKLTDYNWSEEIPYYYHITNGKINKYTCYQDLPESKNYQYQKGSNAEITFTDRYGNSHKIVDIGLDNALILVEKRSSSYTKVSILSKCDRKFHLDKYGVIVLDNGEESKYNDYEKYSFISPYLGKNGTEDIRINGKKVAFSPKTPYASFFNSYALKYGDYIPDYKVKVSAKNSCRIWDYWAPEGETDISLFGQGNEYYAFLLHNDNNYILEEWTKWFRDVPKSAWYYNSVKYVYDKGFMSGYENGMFGVVDNIRRQDFVLILARIAGADLSKYNTASKFRDVPKGAYYAAAVNWAVQKGIVSGYQNGRFGVGDAITREQVATILYKYIGSPTVSNADKVLASYKDVSKISSYAKVPLAWAVNKGIISGMSDGRIAAKEGASRAQIASIIMRMDQRGFFKK
ncbi:MAG: S-layer homology domain-containing protein [Clostridia bacterium]|nr:S-layer homology domain-containing protein [Clostridia bacterium]